MDDKQPEVSFGKKIFDKFLRAVTGAYEEQNCKAITSVNSSFNKYFGKIPEVLNVGESFDNRRELDIATFKTDYWIDQLRGGFYEDCERVIEIMCSYEIERQQRFVKGWTDDPIHLLFYEVKQYAVKLSSASFDLEDIIEAKKWHSLFRELIVNQVFPGNHQDTRLQVLFDLEQTFKKSIIPKLETANENKSALEHLKSVSAHLTKFLDIGFKYLFYVGRDSDYVPNFSIRKLRLMKDKKASQHETLGITETEHKFLDPIKDTWPIELLYKTFGKSDSAKNKEHLALMGGIEEGKMEEYSISFSAPMLVEKEISKLISSKKGPDFFAKHMDVRSFVNAHLLLSELAKFKELFDIARGCAEMGGNLLTFGLLREQLVTDLQDCSKYIYAIKSTCDVLEECAWEAFRRHAAGHAQVPEKWKDNYTKSGVAYFNSLNTSYELCQAALVNLAAAATRKSRNELLAETEKVVSKYIRIHTRHRAYREDTLQKLNHLSSFHSELSSYNAQKALTHEGDKKTFVLTKNPKDDFKQFREIIKKDQAHNYTAISGQFFQRYSKESNDAPSQYYTGRLVANVTADSNEVTPKMYYESALKAQPNFFKANYRLSQLALAEGNVDQAKSLVATAMISFEEQKRICDSMGVKVNDNAFNKMTVLQRKIVEKQSSIESKKFSNNK